MTTKKRAEPPLRQLPADIEAERSVLGAILLSGTALDAARVMLRTEDFSLIRHRIIWDAMLELGAQSTDSMDIDYLQLCDKLRQLGKLDDCGGLSYIAELVQDVFSAAQILTHAKIVKEQSLRRQLIRELSTSIERLYECEAPDVVGMDAQAAIFQRLNGREAKAWQECRAVMMDTVDFCDRMQKLDSERLLGIPSGLIDLDAMLGGWQRGTLIIVGGRPSMGKTALALKAALEAAMRGLTVGFVSLEMTGRQLGLRMLSMEARVNLVGLRMGERLTSEGWRQIVQAAGRLEPLPLYIDDSSALDVHQLRAKARQLKSQQGLDLLVVDYLQLMSVSPGLDRRQGLEEVSRGLKLIAKELDIAVIALSQLSRSCEQREDKRPLMSDLRETGSIEQDADVVLMLYRDEVYNPEAAQGEAEILVRKNRDGMAGDVRVAWLAEQVRFDNLERYRAEGELNV
jgi:replicative DNA helicase